MKERGILFSAPMVRAILAGTKTQTRVLVKPQPTEGDWVYDDVHNALLRRDGEGDIRPWFGRDGDRLWVREAWAVDDDDGCVMYRADVGCNEDADAWEAGRLHGVPRYRWRSPIAIPRRFSRIVLEITAVRVERLQDISEADAIAEGVVEHQTLDGRRACNIDGGPMMACGPIHAYRALWDSINGTGSWDANPWVWVIEFCRV